MHTTLEARIEANGEVKLLEPITLPGSRRALVTVLEDELLNEKPRVLSKYAGAFSSGHRDTSTRVDELLEELGFGE
jgi:hypothetical protein